MKRNLFIGLGFAVVIAMTIISIVGVLILVYFHRKQRLFPVWLK